ncbi:MAG: type II secretion system protein GspG [Deltaproteobacteria bacterium]|nr:type II secretion system protein GspG [Deltaproteobacteria bacterium]
MLSSVLAIYLILEQGQINGHGREYRARAQLSQIESALAFYHIDNGVFPSTEQGLLSLVSRPEVAPFPRNYPPGGYFKKRDALIDPWGAPFAYEAVGDCYRAFTLGADQLRGGEGANTDIVSSWGCSTQ